MPTLDYDHGYDEMSEWLDIGPTVEEEAGWGVEETDFTTKLDYSAFTPEQVRQAPNHLYPRHHPHVWNSWSRRAPELPA